MDLYFRTKDNGATVFRVVEQARQRRMDLQPLAEANIRNGDIKPRKGAELSDDDRSKIESWLKARRRELAAREIAAMKATVDQLHTAANWYSSRPDAEAAEAIAEDLLIAMHDLRSAIVRFKAKAAANADD